MPDVTPPKPPHPRDIAGKLKGKPAWMYIAGLTVIIGVAFFLRRRAAVDAGTPNVVDNTTGAVGDASLYPSASQGAYGGYSDPTVTNTGDTGAPAQDNAGTPEPAAINIYFPGPTDNGTPSFNIPDVKSASAVATGGVPAPRVVSQHAQVTVTPVAKALAIIKTIQDSQPAHSATAAQAQAQAVAAAAPNVFTQDQGTRSGLNYQLVHKNGKWYRFYESRPGKGDWGEGGKILRP